MFRCFFFKEYIPIFVCLCVSFVESCVGIHCEMYIAMTFVKDVLNEYRLFLLVPQIENIISAGTISNIIIGHAG